ncbi:MAG: TIGR02281 family clan AA aspartic protease, partial [Gammaproteobacteria bacterium]
QTKIASLIMGNAEIKNLDAAINSHLDEMLIGMNALRYFKIIQNGPWLTLISNDPAKARTVGRAVDPLGASSTEKPEEKHKAIKKTVTCDENNVCKIEYSNL